MAEDLDALAERTAELVRSNPRFAREFRKMVKERLNEFPEGSEGHDALLGILSQLDSTRFPR